MNLRLYKNKPISWFDDFANSMDHFWNIPLAKNEKDFFPACDFQETKDYYFFSFDVPGVKKEDIQIEFHDGNVRISGEKKDEYKGQDTEGQKFQEKIYGKFQRSFSLPATVKEDAIEAHYKNGVLELLIPKKQASKGRKISVKEENKSGLFSRLLKDSD